MSRGEWSAPAYRNWDERRLGALLWFPLYRIRYGDSKRRQGMKQDFRPNWYQSLHNPPSPWKVVPYHRGLRPLLFRNSSVGYFMSHKNQNSELKGYETGRMVFRPYQRRLECVTICRCRNKGSTFSSVILRPWVLVRLGFEPTTSGGYYQVPPQRVGFLRLLVWKRVSIFPILVWNWVWFLSALRECMSEFVVSIPNE